MKFILRYAKNYKKEIFLSFLGSLAFTAIMLGLPNILSQIINEGIIAGNQSILTSSLVKMLGLIVLGLIFMILSRYAISILANGIVRDIRQDNYEKMMALSQHEFKKLGVASLTNRIASDAFNIMQFSQMIFGMGMTTPLMIVFSIVMIARTSGTLGIQILPILPLFVLLIWLLIKITIPISTKGQENLDKINKSQREAINGLRVIRGFNRQDHMETRFSKYIDRYRDLMIRLFTYMALPQAANWLIIDTALCVVVWIGASLIGRGDLLLGDLVAFIQYVIEALFSISIFAQIFMMYPRAQVSADRLQEVLDTKISVQNPENPIYETSNEGVLEFKNVDFMYPDADEPVLENISFKVGPGQTLAFIGSTGSGKSTIVKLIPRFYDVTSGEILLDGVNIKDLDLKVLRDKIGYSPQKANLFTGQIQENLKFGLRDAQTQEMLYAAEIAQARDFIDKSEYGLETVLAEGGTNLSGGQKQRLSIARSVIGDHQVYVFDDSFSALDYKTDAKVRSALSQETKDAATIIVAQRVGTIMNADEIIVLDKGRISAKGSHEELMESSELYREIAFSQLSKEELNV